jgi:hypothetical protein
MTIRTRRTVELTVANIHGDRSAVQSEATGMDTFPESRPSHLGRHENQSP